MKIRRRKTFNTTWVCKKNVLKSSSLQFLPRIEHSHLLVHSDNFAFNEGICFPFYAFSEAKSGKKLHLGVDGPFVTTSPFLCPLSELEVTIKRRVIFLTSFNYRICIFLFGRRRMRDFYVPILVPRVCFFSTF